MPLTDARKDTDALTVTLTAEYDAPAERIWQFWSDPREQERLTSSEQFPIKVKHHDLTPGGSVRTAMWGKHGDEHGAYANIKEVEAPHRLVLESGFADADGNPNDVFPRTNSTITLSEENERTKLHMEIRFDSAEAMVTSPRTPDAMAAWSIWLNDIDGILAEDS